MPSETDFLNGALGKIGADFITAIDDGSTNAKYCLTFWPALRQGLLRSHHWNFAEARAELAQDATVPAFEFAFAYLTDPLMLKIKEFNGGKVDTSVATEWGFIWPGFYKVEGKRLLTNEGIVKIVYVKDVENPALWDALFYQAAQTWLASDLALAITKQPNLSATLLQMATNLLMPMAMAVDGQEGTIVPYVVDDLLRGR